MERDPVTRAHGADLRDFEDQVAVVTGAGRGIGAAVAALLAARGARVALIARTREELEARAGAIGARALPLVADVADERAVQAAFEAVRRTWGPPRHLVNNAGALALGPMAALPVADFDRVMAVNVRGAFLCAREILRDRPGAGPACIVNVASISGVPRTSKLPGTGAYAASKAAILALTEVLAEEGRPLGVRVNAVSPGSTATRMLAEAAPGLVADLTPDQVARVIVFCLSAEGEALRGALVDAWG